VTVPIRNPRDRHSIVTVTVTEETAWGSGFLAGVTVVTMMTVVRGCSMNAETVTPLGLVEPV
jgi:hypothetical protein